MANYGVSQRNPASLEFGANQAYSALRKALSEKEHAYAAWAREMYSMLESSIIRSTDGVSEEHYTNLNRKTRKAELFNRYIFQFMLGNQIADKLMELTAGNKKPEYCSDKQTKQLEKELREAIIGRKKYIQIEGLAEKLAGSMDINALIRTLNYVRRIYRAK